MAPEKVKKFELSYLNGKLPGPWEGTLLSLYQPKYYLCHIPGEETICNNRFILHRKKRHL